MKKRVLLAAVFLSILNSATAQEEFEVTNMGGGGFMVGYGNMNVSGLNTFIPASVPALSNNQLLLGGSGHGFMGRLVIGGGGFGMTGDTFATDSLRGSISGGAGTFDVGYAIINKNQLKLFPMFGFGGGGYGVNLTKTGTISTTDITNDPARQIGINHGGLLADFSLNLYTIPALAYNKEDNSYGGFMIGLKIGYLYSIPSSSWTYSGGDITGGPRFGLSMPYAKIVLGGFGFTKNP